MEEPRSIVTVTPPGNVARETIEDDLAEDICNYVKSAFLASSAETAIDEIKAILELETHHYRPPRNYLSFDSCKGGVNENWRRRLCEWMFEVTDHYDFDREVVSFALYYLDKSICLAYGPTSNKKISKRDYQLYAVTSLYLAIKVHGEIDSDADGKRLKLRISAFQELSRGCFTTDIIEAKEIDFLVMLQWRVNPPTCARCIYAYLRLFPRWPSNELIIPREEFVHQIFDVAKYLTELSIFVSDFTFNYNPSTVAYGAILCALDYVDESMKGIPIRIQNQFLLNIEEVSSKLTPESEDIRHLVIMLKKLAPKMFVSYNYEYPLSRTVSLVEVDPAKSAASTSRSISPIVMGTDEPAPKRHKV